MTLFSQSLRLTGRIFRYQFPGLLVLFVAGSWVTLTLEDQLALIGKSDDTMRIVLALSGALADLTEGFVLLFLISWALPRAYKWTHPAFLREPFKRPYIATFFAEYLRVLGQVLLWTLALLIPGFIRYIQLVFVPFIVFFHRRYDEGEFDALQLSSRLVGRRWKLIFPVMIFSIAASILLQLAPNHYAELHTTPIRVIFYFFGTLLSVWTYCFMFLVFAEELRE